jgi:UDP:flavonoid glycosyltransferase YjiC (YdhE family)
MRNAKYVIFSGGHATCFETIKYSKPSICIPTQPEQLGNAAKLEKMNCSIMVKNKNQLKQAIATMDARLDAYTQNVKTLSAFSGRFKGLDRAIKIIEDLNC